MRLPLRLLRTLHSYRAQTEWIILNNLTGHVLMPMVLISAAFAACHASSHTELTVCVCESVCAPFINSCVYFFWIKLSLYSLKLVNGTNLASLRKCTITWHSFCGWMKIIAVVYNVGDELLSVLRRFVWGLGRYLQQQKRCTKNSFTKYMFLETFVKRSLDHADLCTVSLIDGTISEGEQEITFTAHYIKSHPISMLTTSQPDRKSVM